MTNWKLLDLVCFLVHKNKLYYITPARMAVEKPYLIRCHKTANQPDASCLFSFLDSSISYLPTFYLTKSYQRNFILLHTVIMSMVLMYYIKCQ